MNAGQERIDRAIGHIYGAALDAALWPSVLTEIADLTGAIGANLIVEDPRRSDATHFQLGRLDGELLKLHVQRHHESPVNPWTSTARRLSAGAVASFAELVPFGELSASAYYQEILRPQGIVHQICAAIENDGVRRVRIGVFRSAQAGPGGQAEARILRMLAPHLKRAASVAGTIEGGLLAGATGFAALDRLREGVVVLDEQGRVLRANRQAEAVLTASDGLRVSGGRLTCWLPRQAAALDRLIARGAAGRGGGQMAVFRSTGRMPYTVTATPISPRSAWPQERPPAALLLIRDLDGDTDGMAVVLAQIYDLSPRQARVAVEVASGIGLAAIARSLGVSPHTARSHLQQVFRKTGLRNQVALAAMVGRLAVLPRVEPASSGRRDAT